jgi:hypothetical protein
VKRALLVLVASAAVLIPASAASADFSFQTTTLEPPAGASSVESVAVGDLDGRNGPDFVVAYSKGEEGGIAVQLNDGHGHFGAPKLFEVGCRVSQVELADVGAPPESIFPDGHLDAVITCVRAGGDSIVLARMFGDGNGSFSAAVGLEASAYGFANGLAQSHQSFALAEFRGTSGPPIPVWSRLSQGGSFEFHREFCLSYDWKSAQCGGNQEPYIPFVAGVVAEALVFTTGGSEGLLDWGPNPEWHSSTRDFGPEPTSSDPSSGIWRGITIGDLQGDGPDILTSAGEGGIDPGDTPSGRVSVLYGTTAVGVPNQNATTFPSAPGVENISTGDFDLDGKTDVVGTYHRYTAAGGGVSGFFFQAGDGGGHLGSPQETTLAQGERFDTAPIRVADLDGNGTPDAAAVIDGKVQVLLNQKLRPPPFAANPAAPANPLAGIKGLAKKATALANGTLLLGTATNPPTASVSLELLLPATGKAKGSSALVAAAKPKKGKRKAKPTVIGKAKIAVPAGKTVPLKLKLSAKGKALLKKGPIHAKLAVKATSTSGVVKDESQPLTVHPPQAKKKKKKR